MAQGNPTVARWQLARELRRLRGSRSFNQVVKDMRIAASSLSRWEHSGKDGAVPGLLALERLLAYYDVSESETTRLLKLREEARQPGWWQPYDVTKLYATYIGLENSATEIQSFQAQLIPGLLQTEDYARAVTAATNPDISPDAVERLVEVRMTRHSEWMERSKPKLVVILGETAIRQEVGSPAVMHAQLAQLLELTEQHHMLTLQVLPYSAGGHEGLELSSFVIINVSTDALTTVYLENPTDTLFLDTPQATESYQKRFNGLRTAALSTTQSRKLLETVAREHAEKG